MQLSVILTRVESPTITPPTRCPYKGCRGKRLRLYQQVNKPLQDSVYRQMTVHRYQCLTCKRTFRVYPPGVSKDHTSRPMKDLATILYMLGLNYAEVAKVLALLGVYLGKSWVYNAVRATTRRVHGLKRCEVFEEIGSVTTGEDLTTIKFRDQWLPLRLSADASGGLILTIDGISKADARTLRIRCASIAQAVGAELRVGESDVHNAFPSINFE